MMNAQISNFSLIISSILVIIALVFSYSQHLKLERDIFIGVARAVVQLTIVGYLLNYIFGLENPIVTLILLLFMIGNGAWTASESLRSMKNTWLISAFALFSAAFITLSVLVLSGSIEFKPNEVIPIGGMIISNSMVAVPLVYKQLKSSFKERRDEVETKLALGADLLPASMEILRDAIKTGMLPSINSAKTLGIVALPGMMSGLILAGVNPMMAVKYQIMVTFMLMSTTSIASFIAAFMIYKNFFNERKQLQ